MGMALQSIKDLKRRRNKLQRYLVRYGKWRKTAHNLRINNPVQFEKFVAGYSNNKPSREWMLKREIKAQDCKEELREINAELHRMHYMQPIVITSVMISLILSIGLLSMNTPTGFAVSTTNIANEVFINVPADKEIVAEHLVFNSILNSCSNLDVSVDGRQIDYSIVRANYDNNGCKDAYVLFTNINYNIKDSKYRIVVYEV